ncbi:MAG: hypothetical protein R2873_08640 [Caldilineaceae bacterium]
MRVLAGHLTADGGAVMRQSGLTVGYLRQEPVLAAGRTVWEEGLTASPPNYTKSKTSWRRARARLGDPAVYGDEERLARVLDEQARLLQRFEGAGGLNYEGRVRRLGPRRIRARTRSVAPHRNPQRWAAQAGGVSQVAGHNAQVAPLDEPDNLDMVGKTLLESIIRDYKGGVVIVSHDRYLLDVVADEIAELEDGRMTVYPGNYSEYAFEKQARLCANSSSSRRNREGDQHVWSRRPSVS